MNVEQFDADWAWGTPWMQRALGHDELHAWTLDDVRKEIEEGRAHFWRWPMDVGRCPSATAVTQFINYPRFRVLNYWLLGGDMASIRALLPHVEDWGLMQGCTRFMGEGRRGFERSFARDGYRAAATLYLKQVSVERLQ